MSFGMHGGGMGGGVPNPNNDFQVANPPSDGVSSLSWSPTANFLVATCWAYDSDNVLCYEVQANGQAMPKAAIKHEAPVLCSAWSADGSAVFEAGNTKVLAAVYGPREAPMRSDALHDRALGITGSSTEKLFIAHISSSQLFSTKLISAQRFAAQIDAFRISST